MCLLEVYDSSGSVEQLVVDEPLVARLELGGFNLFRGILHLHREEALLLLSFEFQIQCSYLVGLDVGLVLWVSAQSCFCLQIVIYEAVVVESVSEQWLRLVTFAYLYFKITDDIDIDQQAEIFISAQLKWKLVCEWKQNHLLMVDGQCYFLCAFFSVSELKYEFLIRR